MRKRFRGNDTEDMVRPHEQLTDEERERIRQSYRDGCKGDILIGLRGEERVITMLLPTQPGHKVAEPQLSRAADQLRIIGCDRYLHVWR